MQFAYNTTISFHLFIVNVLYLLCHNSIMLISCQNLSYFHFFYFLYIYIYISWPTVVEGNSKAPFSIATTPRCKEGCYFFPWISIYSSPVPHNAALSKKVLSTIFESLVWLDLEWNTGFPDHWRTFIPLCQWVGYYIYIYIYTKFSN